MGVFNQRFEALFPPCWSPGLCGLLRSPPFVPVYLWASVGPRGATRTLPAPFSATPSPALLAYLRECGAAGSASGQTACPIAPTLRQSQSRQGNSSPLHPGCPSPPLLLVWMNVYFFIYLVSDFLAVRFSVSSGCGRRRSVSTYAAILVLPALLILRRLSLSMQSKI